MSGQANIILGLSPGTNRMGIAIGNSTELIDWQIKVFDERYCDGKIKRMCKKIDKIIAHYSVTAIAIKVPHPKRSSPPLNACISGIVSLIEKKELPVSIYSIEQIMEGVLKDGFQNRHFLTTSLVAKYPELRNEYRRMESDHTRYVIKLFEAVGAMELALSELQDLEYFKLSSIKHI